MQMIIEKTKMVHDIMSQFHRYHNSSLQERIKELKIIIDQTGSYKDLQALFPQLIYNIFAPTNQNGWGLGQVTYEKNRYEFEMLMNFLVPHGPMFRLCYKLLADRRLKYNLPLNILPLQLQMTLERGRGPQFYAELITMDYQGMNVVALALNPFDYYIINFALFLINNYQSNDWRIWNSVYFALSCDYLVHFLPCDPNVQVTPTISYTGKVPLVPPLQTVNRPLCSPSLLIKSDLFGPSNQRPTIPHTQSRYEIWRSETVLQIFVDIWMSVEPDNTNLPMYQRNYPTISSSPERVRIVRVLVKHIHSFSAQYNNDPTAYCALRKYASQIMCSRGFHYVKDLVMTWPLDDSFRLVLELWLSLIQPWRYTDYATNQYRFPNTQRDQEGANDNAFDESFTQFVAENFPSYTCIFQMVIPRFMNLDISTYKNAVMLFRLGKVFSQPHLAPILMNIERAIIDVSGSPDYSHNNSSLNQSFTYNGVALKKWVSIAKQAFSVFNMSVTYDYDPIWSDNKREFMLEFVKRIHASKRTADKNIEDLTAKLNQESQGFWHAVKKWVVVGCTIEDTQMLQECQKIPNYLTNCVNYFVSIFGLDENMLLPYEAELFDDSVEHSSYANSNNFLRHINQKMRIKPSEIRYMGNPDIVPIMSYENTTLVRMLYQLSTRLNELYGEEFSRLWARNDFWGYVARELLQKPITIRQYGKDSRHLPCLISEDLPARLSLRCLGSHVLIIWICIGYIIFWMFSCSAIFYLFFIFTAWALIILAKAYLKKMKIIDDRY
ncbi:sphingomyelin phosphodiesterase 4 [Bicyclus anynana]|uniref:Sphingomyelin phosphodiesterase 4 n=1 Tax=Bicyclus anynana TaxID=110368 RepID=A0ABM3M528_BICAN|nr:sphingomyelin phosphodiesterase 4 [Bicyclus anynana]